MTDIFLALGSNLGERPANLQHALDLLRRVPVTSVKRISPFYDNPPEGGADQPPYLNAVAHLESGLEVKMFHTLTLAIEKQMGRSGKGEGAPRIIDLDILLFGEKQLVLPGLEIPHPRLARRWFVLKPLCDLDPGRVIPGLGMTVAELLRDLEHHGN